MNRCALLAGSNLGDRLQHIRTAKMLLIAEGCLLLKESSIFETAAWGNTNQSPFLNQAWLIETKKDPHLLLTAILQIEMAMGRKRILKWEPRNIDIDILFFNEVILKSESLVVPHPHLHERRFVLAPLAEIIPQWEHPVLKKTVFSLLQEVQDTLEVNKYEPK